ncbi:protein-ADP-ribose hydrolase [Arabiibacter massiliensis]|uniref:protein-ADP-ribose hydrolase n=1 Tax=Arabiibacter massiliensis TaxID=1870985 RepID=UPI0009BA6E43|nr:protein-ADP-ribose hydrolase [Arabiibacter massiliensis]
MDETYAALGRLVAYLGSERPEYAGLAVPDDPAERWAMARALMNMRPPLPVPPEVLADQDAVLQARMARTDVADARELPAIPGDDRLALWRGDITTLAADAIVNAANCKLLGCFIPGHHCIDNAIHTFAGMQLRLACDDLMRAQGHDEPTGQAKVTPAFNLPARFVVHTVGPMVPTGRPTPAQDEQLASCYRSCLDAAADAGCASVAFCCISTGEFRFPRERAARIAVDEVRAWLAGDARIERVVFDVFGDADEDVYRRLLLPA